MSDDTPWWGFALVILGLVVLFSGLVYALSYRSVDLIDIQDRYWVYRLYVRYDETVTELVTYYEEECVGYGDDRTCRSSPHTRLETHTETHTRCSNGLTGKELPPIRPAIPCEMQHGDYINEGVSYYLVFVVSGKGQAITRRFPSDLWDTMAPGTKREVIRDVFGDIRAQAHE